MKTFDYLVYRDLAFFHLELVMPCKFKHRSARDTRKYRAIEFWRNNFIVYYEEYDDIEEAIAREKQIKAGSRQKKIDLINSLNPAWEELFAEE